MPLSTHGSSPPPISRRRLMRWLAVGAAGGVGAMALPVTGCGHGEQPAGSAPPQRPAASAGSATPAPVRLAVGDIPENGRKVVWLGDVPVEVRHGPDGIEARSLLCTHFGCPVKWDEASQRYACPCHNGVFDAAGEVVGGPPVKPLRRVPVARSGAEVVVGAES